MSLENRNKAVSMKDLELNMKKNMCEPRTLSVIPIKNGIEPS